MLLGKIKNARGGWLEGGMRPACAEDCRSPGGNLRLQSRGMRAFVRSKIQKLIEIRGMLLISAFIASFLRRVFWNTRIIRSGSNMGSNPPSLQPCTAECAVACIVISCLRAKPGASPTSVLTC